MANNKILIQQAYYGEVNKAHACITQSVKDSDLTSFLIAFTDRPAALPPNIELMPYLSGTKYANYYIFTKTFPDNLASRAGMVFTHALILNINDIACINLLEDIFINFIGSVPKIRESLEPITISTAEENFNSQQTELLPKFIQAIISSLIKGVSPILFSGDIDTFEEVLQKIWNFPDVNFRKKIKFRTSFTPSDISEVSDLTIVCIQKEFISKWTGQNVIKSDDDELVSFTSKAEALFLGIVDDNPFNSFLQELNIKNLELSILGQCAGLYDAYTSLITIENPDTLRQNVRILSKVSPHPNHGEIIKNRFLEKLEVLISTGRDTNLKALRNINWQTFSNGESRISRLVTDFIDTEFKKTTNLQTNILAEILNCSITEEKQVWHFAVYDSFQRICSSVDTKILLNLWKLIDFSQKTLSELLSFIQFSQESNFTNTIPNKLKLETVEKLEGFANGKKWYLFHSKVLLKYYTISDVLKKQLILEKNLPLKDSVGVKYLVSLLNDREFLKAALLIRDEKLAELVAERVIKNKSVLEELDVANTYWNKIWAFSLEKTRNISFGIENKEKNILNSVFNLINSSIFVEGIIIELIANSSFSDISTYPKRSELWEKIPLKYKDKFLDITAKSILGQFLSNQILFDSIEKEISDKITSDSFMSNFLNTYQNDIDSVIKVFETFSNLKDIFLSDFIKYYKYSITAIISQRLGRLVSHKRFEETAKSIYDKSKYDYTFKNALDECKDLVKITWFDEIFSSHLKQNKHSKIPKNSMNNSTMEKQPLPTVVILTAIKEEYAAVRLHLEQINDIDQNDSGYEEGYFQFNGKIVARVIIRECGAKNTSASQETERAIQYFSPNMILFVGIAGSRKPKDFSIGDVIFPEKIYSYEGGKSEKDSFRSRPDLTNTTYTLLETAKKERRKEDWKILIKNDSHKNVKADLGIIASGEQVVEHVSSEIGEILTKHFNDTSVIEMEGFGFGKAASRQGRETSYMLIGIIRGISDILEQTQQSQDESGKDRRPDNAKQFASDTAAAFAFWLVYKTYA
ncbi:hypothetical protein [Emticicia sp.]|uniref:GAP1-N1 domain-containing protein n=1 Tax=Emticicia sp. TaxID=1930953 RepID=UPI003751EFA7